MIKILRSLSTSLLFGLSLGFVACSGAKPVDPPPPPPNPVTGVWLIKSSMSMVVGQTETLMAIILPDSPPNEKITWESDNPDVATLDNSGFVQPNSGIVTAVAVGSATITVKTDYINPSNGQPFTAICAVTVTTPPEWTITPEADVYVVGDHNMVMKNGKIIHRLEKGGVPMYANSVFVYGEDVYVAGHKRNDYAQIAALWKNGELQNLELVNPDNEDYVSSAASVFVYDGNVYVAGYETLPSPEYKETVLIRVATLWINGVPTRLPNEGMYGTEAKSVFVSDGDVYVGGYNGWYEHDGIVWKNGEILRRYNYFDWNTGPGRYTSVYSVFVSNGDVYAATSDWAGFGFSRAILWKNDEPQLLGLDCVALGVFVEGDDVYVVGNQVVGYQKDEQIALLWENGVKQRLTDGEPDAWVRDVFVLNNNVYVAGILTKSMGNYNMAEAALWVNGEAISLEPYGFSYGQQANSVYVVSRAE